MNYTLKDSGKRQDYKSGMRRDIQEGKPRYDLILPESQDLETTLLYRWSILMEKGIQKYGTRNWEKANSQEELERFKASAFRHFMQAMSGKTDEDHFAAVLFNLNAVVYLTYKLNEKTTTKKSTN